RDAPWPVRIINWGFWDAGEAARQVASNGALPLSATQGVEALARIMAAPAVQVAALRLEREMRPFLGIDDSLELTTVGAPARSNFSVIRALALEPAAGTGLAACRTGF